MVLGVIPRERICMTRRARLGFHAAWHLMEETVQALFDEGALARQNGTVALVRPLGSLKIPPTVQAILAARIDRLHNDEKNLLQTLAILGREFVLSLARAVAGKSRSA